MRVSAGRVDELPTDRAVAVGDGEVVVVRSADGEVCAYRNACLHKGLSLDGARVQLTAEQVADLDAVSEWTPTDM